jgi:hypothetical protein
MPKPIGSETSENQRDLLNGLPGDMIGHVWPKYVISSKIAGPIARQSVIRAIVKTFPNWRPDAVCH